MLIDVFLPPLESNVAEVKLTTAAVLSVKNLQSPFKSTHGEGVRYSNSNEKYTLFTILYRSPVFRLI